MNWSFTLGADVVFLHAIAQGGANTGDIFAQVKPGETFQGVAYDELAASEYGGSLTIDDDGTYRIAPASQPPPPRQLTEAESAEIGRGVHAMLARRGIVV